VVSEEMFKCFLDIFNYLRVVQSTLAVGHDGQLQKTTSDVLSPKRPA